MNVRVDESWTGLRWLSRNIRCSDMKYAVRVLRKSFESLSTVKLTNCFLKGRSLELAAGVFVVPLSSRVCFFLLLSSHWYDIFYIFMQQWVFSELPASDGWSCFSSELFCSWYFKRCWRQLSPCLWLVIRCRLRLFHVSALVCKWGKAELIHRVDDQLHVSDWLDAFVWFGEAGNRNRSRTCWTGFGRRDAGWLFLTKAPNQFSFSRSGPRLWWQRRGSFNDQTAPKRHLTAGL